MPHYKATIAANNEVQIRLIEAPNPASALRAACEKHVKVEKVSTGEAIALVKDGVECESVE